MNNNKSSCLIRVLLNSLSRNSSETERHRGGALTKMGLGKLPLISGLTLETIRGRVDMGLGNSSITVWITMT